MLNYMLTLFHAFWADEEGATAIEYGLIIAVIALVVMAGMMLFGADLNTFFSQLGDRMPAPTEE